MAKVSVCIPSYNLADVIGETISSVLNQTFTDFELLIEDDGSTDNSAAVISQFRDDRIRFVHKLKNEGQNETTNNLVKRATGDYICLLAADDVWPTDKLSKQTAYLEANPACGIVFGRPEFMDHRGKEMKYADETVYTVKNMPKEAWQKRFLVGNCLFISTSMYRRSLHEELGYFDTDYPILADLDWYMRIVSVHELHIIEEKLAKIRMRDGNANLSAPTRSTCEKHADEIQKLRKKHNPNDVKKKKFLIATPFYEVKGYSPYIRSLVYSLFGLAKFTNIEWEYMELSGDSYVWRARNQIADYFMKSDCSHLVFIDADHGWEPEGFYRLLNADAPIVGSAYPVKNNWEHYGVTVHCNDDHTPKVNDKGLIYAQKVPTGFMKISRNVFERLKDAEPDNWYWSPDEYQTLNKIYNYFGHILEDHVIHGEDISFCKRWERIGGTLMVEPRVTIEHWGAHGWKGNYHEFLTRQPGGSRDPKLTIVNKEAA